MIRCARTYQRSLRQGAARSNRRDDDEGILQARGDGNALLDQQRPHPIGKAVKAEHLAEIEHHEHHDQRQIRRPEQVAERHHRHRGASAAVGHRIETAARPGRSLESALDGDRLGASAVAREPGRAFGHKQPQHPDHHAGGSADQHHPAPAIEVHGRQRHQPPREERHDRHGDEHHRPLDDEGAPAHPARHELGDVGVDGDDLDSDADPGDEPPHPHPARAGLERHDHRGRAVGKQRPGEDRAAAEPVGEKAETCRRTVRRRSRPRRHRSRRSRKTTPSSCSRARCGRGLARYSR